MISKVLRGLDTALAGLVLGLGAGWLVLVVAGVRLVGGRGGRGPRRIMYFGTGRIAQVFPRNGQTLFLEGLCSDFDGYFEQLWNVHFPAGARGWFDLTPRHHLVDFDVTLPGWPRLLRRSATALREVAFLAWVLPYARRHGISIIVGTDPYLQGLNAALASRALEIPFGVLVQRDYDWDWEQLGKQAMPSLFPSRSVEKRVERWVFRRAALVLADRGFYAEVALRNGAAPEKVATTRVLADPAFARARPNPGVRERLGLGSGPLLVYVGRLDPDKLAMDLVECLALVRQRFPSARLACAGSGPLEQAMRERGAALGVADGLRLLGPLALGDLAELLASCDAVVAGHMGYTLVEAGLAGTPIATYDYDFHGEILEHGVSGLLVPLRDVPALAEAVCSVLADPADGVAMGARTRRRLLREHTRAAVFPLYQAAYARVLREGGRRDGTRRPARTGARK